MGTTVSSRPSTSSDCLGSVAVDDDERLEQLLKVHDLVP